jgi:hypothetical protein
VRNAEYAAVPKKPVKSPGANIPRRFKTPISVKYPGLWKGSLTRAELIRQISQEVDQKFVALMNYYRIPLRSPDKWKNLSLRLAEELGLMVVVDELPRGPGRPRVSSEAQNLLVERMDRIVNKGRLSEMSAATHLTNEYPEYKLLKPKTLLNRYSKAKRMTSGSLSSPLNVGKPDHPEK